MKSLWILLIGFGIMVWGFYLMWEEPKVGNGFKVAKPFYIVGGAIFLIGSVVNHREHLRRK
jgi:hypothetical protein